MRILIIDNNTSFINALKNIIAPISSDVINIEDLKYQDFKNYNLIILSGGHPNTIVYHHNLYEEEIKTILRSNIPILGICFGFELIVYSFGGKLREMPEKENGIITIEVIGEDSILKGLKKIKVFESHRWVAESLPAELIPLAKSRDGIEIIKHKTRSIYGFQFHPEIVVSREDLKIFKHLLQMVSSA